MLNNSSDIGEVGGRNQNRAYSVDTGRCSTTGAVGLTAVDSVGEGKSQLIPRGLESGTGMGNRVRQVWAASQGRALQIVCSETLT